MNSLQKQKQSQLGQEIARCGCKVRNRLFICALSHEPPQIGFRTKSARFIKKASEPKIAGEWRAFECVFGYFSHLLFNSELSIKKKDVKTKWWWVRWERVRVYHEWRHIVFEAGEHKKWFNIWNAESDNVYSDINSKKEGKVWRET